MTAGTSTNYNINQHLLIQNKKKRKRNIKWYNPPFSKNVSTNIERLFLKLIKEEFTEDRLLHPIFNKNALKVSYCSRKV